MAASFEKLLQVLVLGSANWRISDKGCSSLPLRCRRDEWIEFRPAGAYRKSPSEAWTAGQMISTVDDLLLYRRALGTGRGLLSPEQHSVRLDSFVDEDVPPLNEPPLKGDLAYGIGLGKDHGWIGHNGEIPGYNTYLFHHPYLDAVVVVEVNSDISSGKCPKDVSTKKEWSRSVPCELPADRIFEALAQALGKPSPSPPE